MTISYLVTVYNKEEFIGGVIDSILAEQAQTGGEIIVYDDCSTDRSPEIIAARAAANRASMRVIRGEKNHGVSFATNRLLEAATQPYIRLVDGDDLLVPGSTAQLLRLLQKHKLGFIYGRMIARDNGAGDQSYEKCFMLKGQISVVLRHLTAYLSSSLFTAAALKTAYPIPEWIQRTQDFTIFLRVLCHGAATAGVDDVTALLPAFYTASNMSSASAALYAEMCRSVALDEKIIPLPNLRNVSRRYAGRATKYFLKEGESRLTAKEKFDLWRWRHLAWMASPQTCVRRLMKTAALFDRDRHVVKGLRKA